VSHVDFAVLTETVEASAPTVFMVWLLARFYMYVYPFQCPEDRV